MQSVNVLSIEADRRIFAAGASSSRANQSVSDAVLEYASPAYVNGVPQGIVRSTPRFASISVADSDTTLVGGGSFCKADMAKEQQQQANDTQGMSSRSADHTPSDVGDGCESDWLRVGLAALPPDDRAPQPHTSRGPQRLRTGVLSANVFLHAALCAAPARRPNSQQVHGHSRFAAPGDYVRPASGAAASNEAIAPAARRHR
jgi:hypothetical protein